MSQDKNFKNSVNTSSEQKSDKDRIWSGVERKIETYYTRKRQRNSILKISCIIVLCGLGLFIRNQYTTPNTVELISESKSIVPGSDKATLTTEDGITLDLTVSDSIILKKQGLSVLKNKDGEVIYSVLPSRDQKHGSFQTISTPRGAQTKILLPDGSLVRLNASSSLSFSNNLHHQNVREVSLIGEGYFDVKHNNKQSFRVKTHHQVIQVLGTQFNINSYNNNQILTTLVEGSVKINDHTLLKPGQQAIVNNSNANPLVRNVDVSDYIDWVNNQFIFRNEHIKSIMIRLSRWYNFDVQYAMGIDKSISFNGEISRYSNVQDVLKLLSKTSNLEFKITGKVILVK